MIKISAITAQLVHQSPFIAEALEEGLINVAALARKLQPEVSKTAGKPVQTGAIVMAIQRIPPGSLHRSGQLLRAFFRKVQDISVRSGLLDYTFRNSATLAACQARLIARIGQKSKDFYSVSRGISETTLLISQAYEQEVDDLFAKENRISKESGLNAISLMLPDENRVLFGIYYFILRQLAWNGINVAEVVSTSNEFTIVVGNEDLDRAFSALMRLKQV